VPVEMPTATSSARFSGGLWAVGFSVRWRFYMRTAAATAKTLATRTKRKPLLIAPRDTRNNTRIKPAAANAVLPLPVLAVTNPRSSAYKTYLLESEADNSPPGKMLMDKCPLFKMLVTRCKDD